MAKEEKSSTAADIGLQTPHIFLDTEVFHRIERLVQTHPALFEHWRIGMIGAFA